MRAGALSRQFSLARGWPLLELSTNQNEAVLNLARSPDRSSELLGNCIDDDEFLVLGAMTRMSPEPAVAANILPSFIRNSLAFDSSEYLSRRFAGLIN
jgi:hypothetical protein